MSADSKVWFITGSSTGFGREMVQVALAKGDVVIATLRKPEALADLAGKWPKDKLHVLKLDVTQPSEIADAFAYAKEKVGRIDVVYNNAGVGLSCKVEPVAETEAAARKVFEVNFWGAVHVMQEAVKFFREVNPAGAGGRLLNCSSTAGIASFPEMGYYAASKHALEAVSESLAGELLPQWNIKITNFEPGMFVTSITESNEAWLPIPPAYLDADGKPFTPSVADKYPVTGSPLKAAEVFWRISRLDNPPLRLPLGKDAIRGFTAWGEAFLKGVQEVSSWSDDIAIDSA